MIHRSAWILLLVAVLFSVIAVPGLAQNPPPVFVTNTPPPPAPVISTPAAPINRFVLRPWREVDMMEVLHTRVRQLTSGATELQKAVRLLQYELERRFPAAPHDPADRERLLHAMLAAPPGSVDMRAVMRPYVETLINERGGPLLPFEHQHLQIEVLPANMDGTEPQDAVLHVYYAGADNALIYNDYVPTIAGKDGTFRVLSAPDLPAGKLDEVELMGVGDFNRDGLDELAVSLDTGQINREMRVFGWRGNDLVSLVQPGETILYGEIVTWMADGDHLELKVYREESADWQCLGELDVTWQWSANFFRPSPNANGYFFQNSANCLFYGAEPLFAQPIDEALATINDILAFVPSEDDFSAQRARMIEVMLRAFDGDFGTALAAALDLESRAEPGSWLAQQTATFISALGEPGVTILGVCAALVEASPAGACDVDAALTRIFEEQPLVRERSISEQLAEIGITIQNQLTISEVGRADRQVVRFYLAGEHWWAFAPLDPEFYTAEKVEPLPGFEPIKTPLPVITAPQTMYDALLVNNDPGRVLTILESLVRANPQAALSSEVRYLEAFSFDLLADRTRARQAYYDLWQQSPLSVWGQLAAEHLEQR